MEPNGKLQLEFKRKQSGETYVSKQYFKLPLQVFPANYLDKDGTAFLYLLNPSSGMLEGDLFDIQFHLKEQSAAVITTPSSNKIYRSKGEDTRQEINATVESGSVLEYLPEHNVPYKESRFYQKSVFHVEKNGSLFTWDAVMPGRMARNESFDFTSYRSNISLYYDGHLKLREGMKLFPADFDPHNVAVLEHYHIFATAYLVAEKITEGLTEKLKTYMDGVEGICGGCSMPDEHVLVVKVLFETSLGMQNILWNIWNIVRKEMYQKEAFRIRKY